MKNIEIEDMNSRLESFSSNTKEIICRLGEESKEILGITRTISEISQQTNILALNATLFRKTILAHCLKHGDF